MPVSRSRMLADSDCSDFDRGQSSGAGCTLLPQMEKRGPDAKCAATATIVTNNLTITLLQQPRRMPTAPTPRRALHERHRKAMLPIRSATPAGAGVADRGDL